jgi:hypothetical protein
MSVAMRHFTRLTNAFNKNLSHLKAAIALHFAYLQFLPAFIRRSDPPCMEAKITDHVWSIAELLGAA